LLACNDGDTPSDTGALDSGTPDASEDAERPLVIQHVDRSGLTDIGTSGSLDYEKPAYWACRPDIEPNECHRNLDATEVKSDGTLTVVPHVRAEKPEFDCFYVYPTVTLSGTQMTDFSGTGINTVLDPLLAQAARFTRVCEVYAPLYRQVALNGVAPAEGSSTSLALQDVRDAFKYYLEHFNHGRNFVLMGHSQGTFMLASTIVRDVDDKPELRARLISALLIGGQPYTPPGQLVGGQFNNIPLCSTPNETGCIVGFNSFPAEAPPGPTAVFGHVGTTFANEPPDLTGQVACVNPARLVGNQGSFAGSYFPLMLNNPMFGMPVVPPGITTPFVMYKNLFQGECKQRDSSHYLEISVVAGDTRTPPTYRNPTLEAFGFGLHLVDYDAPLDDLIELVTRQAAALKK
jgi:hypothetical protein